MAYKNFYFPSNTGSYRLPNGMQLRVRLFYENDTNITKNIACDILNVAPIRYDFEFKGSGNDINMRAAGTKIKFYNYNNLFESNGILETTNDIYVSIIIVDYYNPLFIGLLTNVRKSDYIVYEGNVIYSTIELELVDAVKDLEFKTVSDLGFNEQTLYGIITTMGYKIANGLSSGFREYYIQEGNGRRYSYLYSLSPGYDASLEMELKDTNQRLIDFAKKFALYTGHKFFNYNNMFYFIPLVCESNLVTISDDDVINIELIPDQTYLYLSVKTVSDWLELAGVDMEQTHEHTFGKATNEEQSRLELVASDVLNYIYISMNAGNQFHPNSVSGDLPSNTGSNYIQYTAGGFWGANSYADSGMVVRGNYNGVLYDWYNVILSAFNDQYITFYDNMGTPDLYSNFRVDRHAVTRNYRLYKPYLMTAKLADILNKYYILSKSYNMILRGIKSPAEYYTWHSVKMMPKNVEIDLIKNETKFIFQGY